MSATSLPPHDVNSERALLGAALVNPECIPIVTLIVQAQDFFIVCHRWIWEVLLGMIKTGSAIDIVTVSAMLEQISRLAEIEVEAEPTAYFTGVVEIITSVTQIDVEDVRTGGDRALHRHDRVRRTHLAHRSCGLGV